MANGRPSPPGGGCTRRGSSMYPVHSHQIGRASCREGGWSSVWMGAVWAGSAGSGCFFLQAEDGIRDRTVTGVQTCALPIYPLSRVGCLPIVARCLARGSTVLLDNTARDGERQAIAAWRRMYPSRLEHVSGAFTSDRKSVV